MKFSVVSAFFLVTYVLISIFHQPMHKLHGIVKSLKISPECAKTHLQAPEVENFTDLIGIRRYLLYLNSSLTGKNSTSNMPAQSSLNLNSTAKECTVFHLISKFCVHNCKNSSASGGTKSAK